MSAFYNFGVPFEPFEASLLGSSVFHSSFVFDNLDNTKTLLRNQFETN